MKKRITIIVDDGEDEQDTNAFTPETKGTSMIW